MTILESLDEAKMESPRDSLSSVLLLSHKIIYNVQMYMYVTIVIKEEGALIWRGNDWSMGEV